MLLLCNDCHFVCRFHLPQQPQRHKKSKFPLWIHRVHILLWRLKRHERIWKRQQEKRSRCWVDFCFRNTIFLAVFAFCIWIARDCWIVQRSRQKTRGERRQKQQKKNLFLLSGRHFSRGSLEKHSRVMLSLLLTLDVAHTIHGIAELARNHFFAVVHTDKSLYYFKF